MSLRSCWPDQPVTRLLTSLAITQVTDARGLLPARTPIGADALPPAWRGVAALLIRLPGACVPPAVFRDHLREAAARGDLPPPEAIDELHSEDQLERARCV
eukprot:scaffold153350_cov30-Tisochrysis_lutea.AAC.3